VAVRQRFLDRGKVGVHHAAIADVNVGGGFTGTAEPVAPCGLKTKKSRSQGVYQESGCLNDR
jgi:hypothetical protein